MSYQALYRKWRPRTFDEVKGQDAIITTLKNQVVSGRIGHAYLFCGTRGTGKTSVAKIFARAVNCEALNGSNTDPVRARAVQGIADQCYTSHIPCNECPTCVSILNESSMNVIEIDAASNNGVDNIRDIREQVQYPPTEGRYKVFIIDEVHMLSTGAFNALLKTLEEPPEYVIFILATTEVHKIPVTVLSRCQRYDFKRISVPTIAARIKELTEAEGIKIEERAIEYIAKQADGAMRDALSLLDECVAFHPDEQITYDQVLEVLGTADISVFADLFAAVAKADTVAALKVVEDAVSEGKELSQFATDFLWFMRNLLILKTADDATSIIDASKENMDTMKSCAATVTKEALMRYIKVVAELINKMRYSSQKRVLLELALIKLMTPQMESDLDGVLDRLSKLEDKIASGNFVNANFAGGMGAPGDRLTAQSGGEAGQAIPGGTGTLNPKKIKLAKAKYEDLMELKSRWKDFIDELSGPNKVLLRDTSVETSDGDVMYVEFTRADVFNLPHKDRAINELKEILEEKLNKEFEFRARLKNEGEVETTYVTEEELGKLVNMEIEIEDE